MIFVLMDIIEVYDRGEYDIVGLRLSLRELHVLHAKRTDN